MTTVAERQAQQPAEFERLKGRLRGLTIAVIVLAVALASLGAWTIYEMTSTSENSVTSEVQTALDDYLGAWNTYDGDAFRSMITDNFEFGFFGDEPWDVEGVVSNVEGSEPIDWHVEMVGDPIMIGSNPWMVAATINVVSTDAHHNPPDGINMAAVFFLVDDGGTLRVTQHWVGGPGIAE